MFIIVIKGTKIGAVYPLDKEGIFIIGRGEDNDIQILDSKVSRKHCQIEKTRSNNFYIKDLNSTNKTFVNKTIVEDIVELRIGDIIGIGDSILVFTDQKDLPIKSVEDFRKLRIDQTMRIDLPPG